MADKWSEETVKASDDGLRLDKWMKKHHNSAPNGLLQKWVRKGDLRVNKRKIDLKTTVKKGDIIKIPPYNVEATQRKHQNTVKKSDYDKFRTNILTETPQYIVFNKPQGLPSQGGTGVKVSIDDLLRYGAEQGDFEERPKLVHRIDKDTSGIFLIAKTTQAAQALTKAFKDKQIEKTYIALVVGRPPDKQGEVNAPLAPKKLSGKIEKAVVDEEEGKPSLTSFRMLDNASNTASLLELIPHTGRMHQLRVHMDVLGTPILGDGKYGGKEAFVEGLGKTMHLHASSITIPPGIIKNRKPLSFTAPLPQHIKVSMETLGLAAT